MNTDEQQCQGARGYDKSAYVNNAPVNFSDSSSTIAKYDGAYPERVKVSASRNNF